MKIITTFGRKKGSKNKIKNFLRETGNIGMTGITAAGIGSTLQALARERKMRLPKKIVNNLTVIGLGTGLGIHAINKLRNKN